MKDIGLLVIEIILSNKSTDGWHVRRGGRVRVDGAREDKKETNIFISAIKIKLYMYPHMYMHIYMHIHPHMNMHLYVYESIHICVLICI